MVLEIIGEVVFDFKDLAYGIWIFKPLLMPLLAFWYYKETKAKSSFDKIILVSLFFSWWGDNFLMPAIFKTDINFLLGLASFLVAHLLYILAFLKTNIEASSLLKKKPYLSLPFLALGAGLLYVLFQENVPGFAEMSIPVVVYASVIVVMVLSALNRYGKVNAQSFKFVMLGAILFMISDSIIALSRFTLLFENNMFIARLLIMPLYVVGQYYIVKGCSLQKATSSEKGTIRFRDRSFKTHQDYFQFMIDELGFPDVLHFFDSEMIPSGDLKLNVDVHTVSKNAPTVVFVPGTSVYGLCYAEILYEIGKKGYNVVAMDPRGHGRSEGSSGDYTIEELILDVENVVAFAKKRFNSKVSLMGSSQGGIVCFYLAAKNIKVDTIICQNFADLSWDETDNIARYPKLAKIGKPLIRFLGKAFPHIKVSTLSYIDVKRIKVKYFDNLYNFVVDDPFTYYKISLRAARSLVNAKLANPAEDIKIPLFVFQGDKDIVFPVDYTQKLYAKLTCEKQIKLYPGCDHAIMVENVELIQQDIIDWLNKTYAKA